MDIQQGFSEYLLRRQAGVAEGGTGPAHARLERAVHKDAKVAGLRTTQNFTHPVTCPDPSINSLLKATLRTRHSTAVGMV